MRYIYNHDGRTVFVQDGDYIYNKEGEYQKNVKIAGENMYSGTDYWGYVVQDTFHSPRIYKKKRIR